MISYATRGLNKCCLTSKPMISKTKTTLCSCYRAVLLNQKICAALACFQTCIRADYPKQVQGGSRRLKIIPDSYEHLLVLVMHNKKIDHHVLSASYIVLFTFPQVIESSRQHLLDEFSERGWDKQ